MARPSTIAFIAIVRAGATVAMSTRTGTVRARTPPKTRQRARTYDVDYDLRQRATVPRVVYHGGEASVIPGDLSAVMRQCTDD